MAKLPPQIIDIDDLQEPINILCHGDTGSGKTRMWSWLPNMLIIAIEDGVIAARAGGVTGTKVWRAPTWPDIVEAFEWLRDNPGVFEWVLIDSVTKAQSVCLKHIMELVVKANPSRDPHIPSQGDHFKWQLSVKGMITDFNELPENVIWLARSMNRESPDGDDIVVPAIEGKDYGISAWVAGEMGVVCYLRKEMKDKKVVRKLYTGEHPMYWARDRFNVLPPVMQFTSDKGIAEKIVGMLKESDGVQSPDVSAPAPKKRTTKKTSAARRATKKG